jgi:hypothetical protein
MVPGRSNGTHFKQTGYNRRSQKDDAFFSELSNQTSDYLTAVSSSLPGSDR